MIKFILNGTFRSGTTLMWRLMHEANPDALVFAEPLHNELFRKIFEKNYRYKPNKDHILFLKEYLRMGEGFIDLLRKKHPNIGSNIYMINSTGAIEYLEEFHALDERVLIKCTRLHFILGDLARHFQCQVAHIIRHPMDTFLSVMFTHPVLKRFKNIFGVNPYLLSSLRAMTGKYPFYLNNRFEFMGRYFGVANSRGSLFKTKRYFLGCLVADWSIANWYAVHNIDDIGGINFKYEDIASGDGTELDRLSKYSGVSFSKADIHGNSVGRFSRGDMTASLEIAYEIGVGDKFEYLLDRFGYRQ